MNSLVLARVVLILLHNVDGNEVYINVDEIVALQHTNEGKGTGSNALLSKGVKCAISLTNGKLVSVTELCSTIRQAIIEAEKGR